MSGWVSSSPRPAARTVGRTVDHQRGRGGNRAATTTGYTIAHAGRQIRFGPVAFWIVVGTFVIMAGWSVTTATYFAFRDDVLKGLIARQAEQQFAYEDRIAELRAQIDRTTSRQLLDQEQFEQKLEDVIRRQATLELRAASLSAIADPTTTGSIKRGAQSIGEAPAAASRSGRGAWLEPSRSSNAKEAARAAGLDAKLTRVEASLDRVDRRQAVALHQLEDEYEGKARRMRSVLVDLGLKREVPRPAIGGPFVPLKFPGDNSGFEHALARVNARADASGKS